MEEIIKTQIATNIRRIGAKFLVALGLMLVSFSVLGASAEAASLIISPSSRSLTEGESFSIDILVSSPDQTINAAEGTIYFPPDKLRAVFISDSGSIFNLWIKEPSFSNSLGVIDFSGLVLNPGFAGKTGKMFTVSFQARAPGSAPVAFANGAVLANDGNGTNILSAFRHANYFIDSPLIIPPLKAVPQEKKLIETPEKPEENPPPPEAAVTPQAEPLLYVIQPTNTINRFISLIILLALVVIIWYLWKRSSVMSEELEIVEMEMHSRLDILRQDIERRVKHLEELNSKRELTSEEKEILGELREELVKTAWHNR